MVQLTLSNRSPSEPAMNTTLTLRHFFFTILKPYKGLLSIMAIIGVLWALVNAFMPYMQKLIIDHVVDSAVDRANIVASVAPYALAYVGLWVALATNMRVLDWVKLKLLPSLREDVMKDMFSYLTQHSHQYFQNQFAGSLINKVLDMQSGIVDIFNTLDDMYAQSLGLLVAIIVLSLVHPVFAVILVGWAVVFLVITFLFLNSIKELSHLFSASKTTVVGKMVDSVGNILNVRLFARHQQENQYIGVSIDDAVQKDRAMQAKIIKMRLFWDVSIITLMSFNLYFLLKMYSEQNATVGDFAFVISLSVSILWNLWFMASQFVSFSEQIGRCNQALSIISKPHDIVDIENAKLLIVSKGEINFHNVTFHYDEGAHIFKNKNLTIPGGQKVGLVGFTGSGKSSLVNLIMRLFEVESGEIIIDGQNINKVTQTSLREQIGFIPQDVSLFHRTLMDNIRFGSLNATDQEVMIAAKKAHCDEFISKLPQGYQSMVGERGVKLSGGQRQRIAIARAILKNAPILILDEATSSLDSVTENYIQESLSILMQNKTTIVIAHRLSTLSKMDRILVLDDGKIIEDGTHEELVAKGGHYAKMWHMQAGGFLPMSKN